MQFDFKLSVKEQKEISIILGATDKEKNIELLRHKYLGSFYYRARKDKENTD